MQSQVSLTTLVDCSLNETRTRERKKVKQRLCGFNIESDVDHEWYKIFTRKNVHTWVNSPNTMVHGLTFCLLKYLLFCRMPFSLLIQILENVELTLVRWITFSPLWLEYVLNLSFAASVTLLGAMKLERFSRLSNTSSIASAFELIWIESLPGFANIYQKGDHCLGVENLTRKHIGYRVKDTTFNGSHHLFSQPIFPVPKQLKKSIVLLSKYLPE